MRLSRRRFLAYSGATAAGLALTGAGVLELRDRSLDNLLLQLIDGAPPEVDVRAIGEAYLTAHPDERDRRRLLGLLGLERRSWPNGRRRQMDRIARAIRQDIDDDRFVLLNGWLFARTEARVYALAAAS